MLHHWAISNRRKFEMEGETIWVAPPEYVILRKLEYYREGGSEKHLRDVVSILNLGPQQLDYELLREKTRSYGLKKEWEEVTRMIE